MTQAPPTTGARCGVRRVNRGRGHSYTIDGARVPGVTTLISDGLAKPALPYWSARTVAEFVADADPYALDSLRSLGRDAMVDALKRVPWNRAGEAAVRGTQVHELADRLAHGQQVDVPDHLAGYVESAVRFMDEWQPRTVVTEAVVASRRWAYCGTLDLAADLPGGMRPIIDWKTGPRVYPEVALQLAAYAHADVVVVDGAELPMAELGINAGLVVQVLPDRYEVHRVPIGRDIFEAFLHVAHVARLSEPMGEWIGPASEPPQVSW